MADTKGPYESPFAIPNLWLKSTFTLPSSPPPEDNLFHAATTELLTANDFDNDFTQPGLSLDLRLPDLETFQFGPLEPISPPESARAASATPSTTTEEKGVRQRKEEVLEQEQDVWQLSLSLPAEAPRLRTWETFLSQADKLPRECKEEEEASGEKRAVFVSDAGARAFDAVLDLHASKRGGKGKRKGQDEGDVLQSSFFCKCVALLGEGRSSALFWWDEEQGEFKQTLERVRVSGVSLLAVEKVVQELGHVGARFVKLRTFVERCYASRNPLAARVALARCVQVVLECLEREVAGRVVEARSLLQTEACFSIPGVMLKELQGLVDVSQKANGNRAFMEAVRMEVAELERSCSPFHRVHLDILDRVSRPWVQHITRRVGLSHGEAVLAGYEGEDATTDLLASEESERITELSTGLDILRDSRSDHPLLNPTSWGVELPDLNHSLITVHANHILDKAKRYEADLMHAIKQYNAGEKHARALTSQPHPKLSSEEHMAWEDNENQQAYFSAIGNQFAQFPGQGLQSLDTLPESLQSLVTACFRPLNHLSRLCNDGNADADFAPLNQTYTPLRQLHPYLHAQSRLLNGTLLRLLFRTHRLRQHISLHHSFSLFGNGLFTSRLSAALFSASSATAERKTGEMLSGDNLGLRLDARSKWPPGGSELRLALMGVLSSTYSPSTFSPNPAVPNIPASPSSHTSKKELPGNLSFSIRDLSDAEIEKILDPHSLHALDFLKLSYEPPYPLSIILTPETLSHYDEVFRSLLRLVRMIHVTTTLKLLFAGRNGGGGHGGVRNQASAIKSATAFVMEAHHFTTTLSAYIFDIGIAVPWGQMSKKLDLLEMDMHAEDIEESGEEGGYGSRVRLGLHGLKMLHVEMLESVRMRLLLRRKQRGIAEAVEGVFTLLLTVWSRVQMALQEVDGAVEDECEEGVMATIIGHEDLLALRKGIRHLLDLLSETSRKTLRSGKGAGRDVAERADLDALDMLGLRLDFNGFYSRGCGRE